MIKRRQSDRLCIRIAALVSLAAFCLCASASAATYHVKREGNDSNNGLSFANAWRTIPKACSTAVAGDTVLIYPGFYPSTEYTITDQLFPDEASNNPSYRQILVPLNSGTAANPIVFRNAPGQARPYIQGDHVGLGGSYAGDYNVVTANLSYSNNVILDSLHFAISNMLGIGVNGYGHKIHNCKVDSVWQPDQTALDNSAGIGNFDADVVSSREGDRLVVDNCDISWIGIMQFGQDYVNANGFCIFNGDTVTVTNNRIWKCAGHGIKFKGHPGSGPSTRLWIEGNTISDCWLGINLGNSGRATDSIVCRFNVIYDLMASTSGDVYGENHAIGMNMFSQTSAANTGVWVYNNTIDLNTGANESTPAILPGQYYAGCEVWFFNNIIWDRQPSTDNKAVQFWQSPIAFYTNYNYYVAASPTTRQFFHHGSSNYTLASWRAATSIANITGQDSNSIATATVPFVDGPNHDYRLLPGSPAATSGRGGVYPTYMGAFGTSAADSSISISSADPATEGTSLVFNVTIGTTFGSTCTVTYSTSNGTAVAPGDYTAVVGGQIQILSGSNSGTIIIQTNDDATVESTETMTVTLTNVSIGSIAVSSGQGAILDNDVAPEEPSSRIDFGTLPNHSIAVSGVYDGSYSSAPLTDNVIDPYGGPATTWASEESNAIPHWVTADFGMPLTITAVTVYWAWNPTHSSWTTSEQYRIQGWNGSAYIDLVTVNNPPTADSTKTTITPYSTSRIRIYQPAGQGPSDYTAIMWISELQFRGPLDTTPPGTVLDLR